ncbi:MAG: OmpA family protein [Vicingaceae bacterium]
MHANPITTKREAATSCLLFFILFLFHAVAFGQTKEFSREALSSLAVQSGEPYTIALKGEEIKKVNNSVSLKKGKSNLLIDSSLYLDLSNYQKLKVDSTLSIKFFYGRKGQLHDTLIRLNLKQPSNKQVLIPAMELGMMGAVVEGVQLKLANYNLKANLLYKPLAYMHEEAMKIHLQEKGMQNGSLVMELSYDEIPREEEKLIKVNLNQLALAHDSLFELKLNYDRLGSLADSTMIVKLSQIALVEDAIDEQLVFTKIIDYAKHEKVDIEIAFKGYETISKSLDASNLSSLYQRTLIIPLNKTETLSQEAIKKRNKESFVFVGSILEEGTEIRLPNVRVILKDKKDRKKQFVQLTDAYGSFRDTVYGYQLNTQLSFDVYLKKEGYISKFVLFEEVLKEYGEVDLVEYLKKINLTKAAVGVEIGKAANLNPIYFDLDRANIRTDAAQELDKVVEVLNDLPNVSIELSSHTDSRATDRYNMALSQRRANATTNYLISKGISPSRIVAVGYGESQLVNKCGNGVDCSEEQHALNRRTEFEITDMGNIVERKENNTVQNRKRITKETVNDSVVKSSKDEKIMGVTGSSLAEKEKRKRFSETKTINIFCVITDAKSGKPISGVEVIASDIFDAKNVYTTKTNERGEFSLRIDDFQAGDKAYLDFLLSKKGYISQTYNYRAKITEDMNSYVNLNKFFDEIYLVAADLDVDIRKAANLANIEFEVDQAKIRRKSAIELDKIAAILVEQTDLKIEIQAHTDSRGSSDYNLKLSEDRAKETMNYLVSKGVSYSRITTKGFGEQKLLNHCSDGVKCSEAEHAENRRTEFIIR